MQYLVDTNVLLRFVNRRDPLHETMRRAIRTLRRNGHEICVAPQNCIEFWNVATRPAPRNGFGLPVAETGHMLRLIERLFVVLPETPALYSEWKTLVIQFNVVGVQVHDERLVAMMRVHAISHLVSANWQDFTRYAKTGIVAVAPTDL